MAASGRRRLRAGPWDLVWDRGGLRWLRVDGIEVLRAIQLTARDRSWTTLTPRLARVRIETSHDAFEIRFTARYRAPGFDVDVDVTYVGDADGRITARFKGEAVAETVAQRLGFIVLHPASAAGRSYVAQTLAGRERGAFPDDVVGARMASGAESFAWEPADGLRARLEFVGPRWEMEDQRAWTDASFKSYSPPLAVPHPVVHERGTAILSEIRLSVERESPSRSTVARPRRRPAAAIVEPSAGPLPMIGAMWPDTLPATSIATLRSLGLAHLRVIVDGRDPDLDGRLGEAIEDARRIGTSLQPELVDVTGQVQTAVIDRLVRGAAPVASVLAFGGATGDGLSTTTETDVADLAAALRANGIEAPVGGGTRADYALALDESVALAGLDTVAFSLSPQVHASDPESIIENLATLPGLVRSARRHADGRPLDIAIGFRPRIDAYADPPGRALSASRVDPRLDTPFGGMWLVGTLAGLLGEGAARLTVLEAVGPAGVLSGDAIDGASVQAVMRALLEMVGGDRVPVTVPTGWSVFGIESAGRLRLFVANHGGRHRRLRLRIPAWPGDGVGRRASTLDVAVPARAARILDA